ncbi:MAG: universal stress protein [Bacteroidota bacterium]
MKTLLILTDLSENAEHAAKSAMVLSQNLHANILLYNSCLMVPVAPYYAQGVLVAENDMWWQSVSKQRLEELAELLEPEYSHAAGQFSPTIDIQCGEGNLGENITRIIKNQDIELIVMGAKTGGTFDHILYGSDTNSVIKHTMRPVLVIPQSSDLKSIKKVTFATDFSDGDVTAIHYLVKLGKVLHFSLEIVHVSVFGENDSRNDDSGKAFVAQVVKLKYPDIIYKDVRGKDVINRLNHHCAESCSDVLAMVHHQGSFFSGLLHQSTTKEALSCQKIPLLIIPSKML